MTFSKCFLFIFAVRVVADIALTSATHTWWLMNSSSPTQWPTVKVHT